VISWGVGRIDIVGISNKDGSIEQKYYQDGWSDWTNLGGGPFIGTPVVSSWGSGRLDIWAIDKSGELNHLFWDGYQWQGWEKHGGKFSETPKVVHWAEGKINVVGKYKDGGYHILNYDNGWNGWWDISSGYVSEPGLLAKKGENFLYVFGINEEKSLRLQIWTGYDWQPAWNETWSLGDISAASVARPQENQWPLEF